MPLTFDMPWDELRNYQGRTPKPANFDQYWQDALQTLDQTAPDTEVVPAEFQTSFAECFDLFFTGAGGARIHAQLVRPGGIGQPQPAVLMFHGYSGKSGDWSEKLGFAAAGFTVAALDCRGQGGLSEDPGGTKGPTMQGQIIRGLSDAPEKLLFRQIFLDTVRLARIVMALPEVDAARVGATGASQGGGLTLACAALVPEIKLAAPIYPFLCDYKRVWEIDLARDAYYSITSHSLRFFAKNEK